MAAAVMMIAGGCSAPEEIPEEVPTTISVEEVRLGDLELSEAFSGTLVPGDEASVLAASPAEIVQVLVQEGDRVRRGQDMVRLDTSDLAIQYRQARAAVDSARIQMDSAFENLERLERLYQEGAAPRQQVDAARSQYEALRDGSLKQAQAALDLIGSQMGKGVVTAPIDGVVVSLNALEGQWASPSSPLAMVADLDRVLARFQLSESQISRVSAGTSLSVYVEAVSADPFAGTVISVASVADPMTRMFPVEVELLNPEGILRGGMTATVRLVSDTAREAILVPEDAIRYGGGQDHLFVYRNGVAVRVSVEAILSDGETTAVAGDLSPGDQVIVLGKERLSDGAAVRLAGQEDGQ